MTSTISSEYYPIGFSASTIERNLADIQQEFDEVLKPTYPYLARIVF